MTNPSLPLQPLAEAIVTARRTLVPAPRLASIEPFDRRDGYAVQQAVAEALGARIAGWKVGMQPDGAPMAAPMFAADVRANGTTWPLPLEGALVVEVELAFRLGADLPLRPGKPYTRGEVAAAVAEVLVGIELLASRFAGDGFPPFPLHLADNLGNAGYVTGGATLDFASRDLARLACRYALDGVEAQNRVGGHPQDDPWLPLIACLDEGMMGLGGFCAGQVITTGSLTKPMPLDRATRMSATLEGVGDVEVTFTR